MKDDDGALPPDLAAGNPPPELVRALRALGEESPSAARLAQLAERLAPVLDAPAPGPVSVLARSLTGKAGLAKLLIAALGIGGTVAWLRFLAPSPAVPSAALPQAAPQSVDLAEAQRPVKSAQTTPDRAATAEAQRPWPAQPSAPEVAPRHAQVDEPSRDIISRESASSAPRARTFTDSSRREARATAAQRAAPVQNEAVSASAARDSPSVAAPATPEAQDAHEAATLRSRAEPRASTPRVGEVELLLVARQALKHSAKDALRSLDEHAARFPTGVLAPEREVLAIEALRLLGAGAAAEKRLQAFRANYPNSMHLVRLGREVR